MKEGIVINSVTLVGNVCKTPEIYTTQGGIKRANFNLAVQRKFANSQGVREADFIPIVVWRQAAESCEKYVYKGMKIGVEGYIQTRQYDTQDGQKRNVMEVIAENIEFLSPKPTDTLSDAQKPSVKVKPEELVEDNDSDLPF